MTRRLHTERRAVLTPCRPADLETALRRVEHHCLPQESERAMKAYGQPSAINRLLVLNAELHPGRGTVLLLRETISF